MLHGRTGMRGWACHTTMCRGRMWGRFWPTCWTRNRWCNATFSRIVPIVPRKIYIFAADKQWPGPLKMCHLHENPPSTVSVFCSKWFNQYIVTYCSKEGAICLRWAWYLGCFGTARLPMISHHIPSYPEQKKTCIFKTDLLPALGKLAQVSPQVRLDRVGLLPRRSKGVNTSRWGAAGWIPRG
jgi:hypothetical protein